MDIAGTYLRHREFAHAKMSPVNEYYADLVAQQMAHHAEQMKQQQKNDKPQGMQNAE